MGFSFENFKVVLVEDSRSFAAGLRNIFETNHVNVAIFANAADALAYIKCNAVDLIVTDLEMPEMDGYTFIQTVREDPLLKEVPILVLTGSLDTDAMVKAIQVGADAFLQKSSVRHSLVPQLLALARMRSVYQQVAVDKRLDGIKSLIGTYKHEFGNALMIADGKLGKLIRTHANLAEDESIQSLQRCLTRFNETLKKLDALRTFEEEQYVADTKLLKVS